MDWRRIAAASEKLMLRIFCYDETRVDNQEGASRSTLTFPRDKGGCDGTISLAVAD